MLIPLPIRLRHRLFVAALGLVLGAAALQAQTQGGSNGGNDLLTSPTEQKPAVSMFERQQLTGDWGGFRGYLLDHGVTVNAIYTGEVFGNPTGGRRQGAVYDGLLDSGLDVNLEKLAGWTGASFHFNTYELHGGSGTDNYVGDFGRFSNIDYYDSFRLFELWLEQDLFNGKLSIRFGQLAADKEFFGSATAALFINSDFGVPPTLSGNMPIPAFASAAPGLRVRVQPTEAFFVQTAAFDGNPDPDSLGDPSPSFHRGTSYNRHGIDINLNSKEGAFCLCEANYLRNQAKDATGLPGTYKLGAWYHTDTFSDQRVDNNGLPLNNPASTGVARAHGGDFGGYLIIDQKLYQPAAKAPAAPAKSEGGKAAPPAPADSSTDAGLTGFLRLSGAPGDRNLVSFYLDTGFNYKGLIPGRDKDLAGLGMSYTRFSDSITRFDEDADHFDHLSYPARDEEVVLESSYQAVLTPWFSLQPDAQVIIHPGGSARYPTALVTGLRSVVTF